MPVSVQNYSPLESFAPFISAYEPGVSLVLIMHPSLLTTTSIGDDPLPYVQGICQSLWGAMTVSLIDSVRGLGVINTNDRFPDLLSGEIKTIEEDWILTGVDPTVYIPAEFANANAPFKYECISLTYSRPAHLETPPPLPIGFGSGRGGASGGGGASGSWEPLPSPPYLPGTVWGYPFPSTGGGANCWHGVYAGHGNGMPRLHFRHMLDPAWAGLLTAYPNSNSPPLDEMQDDIFHCFRLSVPSDGAPWWTPQSPRYISRGVNNSWEDSHDALTEPRSLDDACVFQRIYHWLNWASVAQRTTDTGIGMAWELRIEVKCYCPTNPDVPGRVYRPPTPVGLIPPVVGLGGVILPALTGGGLLGIRLYAKDEDTDGEEDN